MVHQSANATIYPTTDEASLRHVVFGLDKVTCSDLVRWIGGAKEPRVWPDPTEMTPHRHQEGSDDTTAQQPTARVPIFFATDRHPPTLPDHGHALDSPTDPEHGGDRRDSWTGFRPRSESSAPMVAGNRNNVAARYQNRKSLQYRKILAIVAMLALAGMISMMLAIIVLSLRYGKFGMLQSNETSMPVTKAVPIAKVISIENGSIISLSEVGLHDNEPAVAAPILAAAKQFANFSASPEASNWERINMINHNIFVLRNIYRSSSMLKRSVCLRNDSSAIVLPCDRILTNQTSNASVTSLDDLLWTNQDRAVYLLNPVQFTYLYLSGADFGSKTTPCSSAAKSYRNLIIVPYYSDIDLDNASGAISTAISKAIDKIRSRFGVQFVKQAQPSAARLIIFGLKSQEAPGGMRDPRFYQSLDDAISAQSDFSSFGRLWFGKAVIGLSSNSNDAKKDLEDRSERLIMATLCSLPAAGKKDNFSSPKSDSLPVENTTTIVESPTGNKETSSDLTAIKQDIDPGSANANFPSINVSTETYNATQSVAVGNIFNSPNPAENIDVH